MGIATILFVINTEKRKRVHRAKEIIFALIKKEDEQLQFRN